MFPYLFHLKRFIPKRCCQRSCFKVIVEICVFLMFKVKITKSQNLHFKTPVLVLLIYLSQSQKVDLYLQMINLINVLIIKFDILVDVQPWYFINTYLIRMCKNQKKNIVKKKYSKINVIWKKRKKIYICFFFRQSLKI